MSKGGFWRWGAASIAVLMVFAAGCAKQQTTKSTESPAAAGAGSAPSAAGQDKGAASGGIVSESLKPEAGAAAPSETRMAAAEAAAAGIAATQEKASPFEDVRFDFDKALIRADAKPSLSRVADYVKSQKGARVLIEGHCDERGTSEYNMALGDRRAESSRAYLVSLGVPAGSLSTVSFGKEKPLDAGHTEDAWAKNRRAHFVVK